MRSSNRLIAPAASFVCSVLNLVDEVAGSLIDERQAERPRPAHPAEPGKEAFGEKTAVAGAEFPAVFKETQQHPVGRVPVLQHMRSERFEHLARQTGLLIDDFTG